MRLLFVRVFRSQQTRTTIALHSIIINQISAKMRIMRW